MDTQITTGSNAPQTTTRTTEQATKEAAARWQAKKAKRLAKKANRRNSLAHKAAVARRAASAADATRHYLTAHNDLMADAIVSRV